MIAMLDALAAPLGPLTSHEDRLTQQDRWVDEGGVALLEALLAVLAAPPAQAQLRYARLDDWATLLVEIAGALGARHPDVALARLLPLLANASVRVAAIDVLGSVGDARAVPALDQLIQGGHLSEDELVHVAGALGEIGGDAVCELLARLRETTTSDQLVREIAIAEQMARGR